MLEGEPMASPRFEALLAALKEPLVHPDDPLEVARQKLEAVHGHPIRDDTRVMWTQLAGVRCAWVETPESADTERVLLLLHGGAWIAAGGDGYLFYAEMLGAACAARVLLVDYRLAPEHRHPAALDDCVDAWRGLLDTGQAPDRVAFIGDSCGGGLVITSLLRARDAGLPMPAMGIALGGWLDLEASGDAAREPVGWDPFASAAFIRARARDYAGDAADLRDPLLSPIYADPSGLPPLLLQVGQVDLTRDDAVRMADRAGRVGVDVTLAIHPEMIHGFQGLAGAGIPEAQRAIGQIAEAVRGRIP
jgi:acetyl esterase/lipase